ncbi:MAG: malto-oligosyltrehalose trehalohydrolase [Thermomicrobiales bacterium]
MTDQTFDRFLGANLVADGVRFAVWAPKAAKVEVELRGENSPSFYLLAAASDGLYLGVIPGIGAGARYRFRLEGNQVAPDPWSRFQPEGVHGPSEVIDPSAFNWTDDSWPGLTMNGLVVYETHVGTYTREGTFKALIGQLPELKRLGIDAIELMPVAACPGRWNWGYDGVDLFAPSANYGHPEDLRRLVDAAHREGLGVILDVVYNHLGPDGNYLRVFSDDYFTNRHQTPWGDAINYDGPNSHRVRDFVIENACYWIREFHMDGLRLDATDAIVDDSPTHVLAEISARAHGASERNIVVIAEEARNDVRTVRPRQTGGYGCDAVWADDFHHELRVYLTGARENYYGNYLGSMELLATAINEGFIYQGEPLLSTGERRGTQVTDEPASAFIFCIQNHDQVGNRPFGERLHHDIDAGRYAVASALLLFVPEPVLLFMGQEFAASTPFLYFTDHEPELGRLVTKGRRREFSDFRAFSDEDMRDSIPDPQAESTFLSSKVDLRERVRNAGIYELYRSLLALRREDSVLAYRERSSVRASPLGAQAIVVHRWHGLDHRLLIANFGAATTLDREVTPGLRDLPAGDARVLLDICAQRFSGNGEHISIRGDQIKLPARSAVIISVAGALRPNSQVDPDD